MSDRTRHLFLGCSYLWDVNLGLVAGRELDGEDLGGILIILHTERHSTLQLCVTLSGERRGRCDGRSWGSFGRLQIGFPKSNVVGRRVVSVSRPVVRLGKSMGVLMYARLLTRCSRYEVSHCRHGLSLAVPSFACVAKIESKQMGCLGEPPVGVSCLLRGVEVNTLHSSVGLHA